MRKLCMKRKTIKENIDKNMGQKCCFLPYFCGVFWIIMGCGLLAAIATTFSNISELYGNENQSRTNIAYVEIYNSQEYRCSGKWDDGSYQNYENVVENNQDFISLPTEIGGNATKNGCNATDYEYTYQSSCAMNYDRNDDGDNHHLACNLGINAQSIGHKQEDCAIYNNPVVSCTWNISFPFCGEYTIPYNFSQGNAVFYLCFDYCSFEGEL